MTASSPSQRRLPDWLPRSRGWWLVAGAFAAGLLLFLVLWLGKRDEFEFYRTDGATGTPEGQVFEPLPVPLPAGETPASGMDDRAPPSEGTRIDQHSAPPAIAGQPPTAPGSPTQAAPDSQQATTGSSPMPRLIHSPAPDYPRDALRARASGDVVIRIDVGADGVPRSLDIVRSSRHRSLDRAALQAVRRWRFEPAIVNGVPVAASVQQTVTFEAPN